MRFPHLFSILIALSLVLPSCGTANRLLKARPAKLTPFFEQPELAQDGRKQVGFQKVWTTPDPKVLEAGRAKQKLYIAPVTLAYLRPADSALSGPQAPSAKMKRQQEEIAKRMHDEFAKAFQRSPAPIYQLTNQPGKDALVLQMALTKLTPTSAQGNVITTVLKLLVTPLATVGGFFTKGNIAMEGKVLVPMPGKDRSHRPFFQFADNEADKFTFFSLRDYQRYGHAHHTIEHWAKQFEKMTRSRKGEKVGDSSAVSLKLW